MEKERLNSCFSIMIEKPISEYDRKTLGLLYSPIVGRKAIDTFLTLHSLVLPFEHESLVENYDKLLELTELNLDLLQECLDKLEAIGLMDTFVDQHLYLHYLKEVPTPTKFFQNEILSQSLLTVITKEAYDRLALELLVRRIDITNFTKITKSFDEKFDIKEEIAHIDVTPLIINTTDGVVIKNNHFDYQHFMIFVSALGIVDESILKQPQFQQFINRYSFLYQLNVEEMRDALLGCVVQGEIDYELFKKHIKHIYNQKQKVVKVVTKQHHEKKDKLIDWLETATPNDVVKEMYNESMAASEIATIDLVLADTGIELGLMNVLLYYVLKEKNGEIPSYQYFLKIIKTWKRAGVKNATDAIAYLNNLGKPMSKNYSKPKVQKEVPSWYDEYLKEANEKLNQQTTTENHNEDNINDLEEFFKIKKEK